MKDELSVFLVVGSVTSDFYSSVTNPMKEPLLETVSASSHPYNWSSRRDRRAIHIYRAFTVIPEQAHERITA